MLMPKSNQRFVWSNPGTYTCVFPKGVTLARCIIIGAGGGGVGFNNGTILGGGGGGGAGGFIDAYFSVKYGTPYTLQVGVGGSSCNTGQDSYIMNLGIAFGGKSNLPNYTELRTNIGTTSVSPGGLGGSTSLYQPSPAITIQGGNGGDGSNYTNITTARDGYDASYNTTYFGGGGGGGICKSQGALGRTYSAGSGGGSFNSNAGGSYDTTGNASGGPGGIFYSGGDSRVIGAGSGGISGAGSGLYGGAFQSIAGFGINCSQTSANTNATTNIGGGGGSGSTASGKVWYSGSGYVPSLISPNLGVPIWIEYFNSVFNFLSGGSSGIRSNNQTTDNTLPYPNLCSGGVGNTDAIQGKGLHSYICGGGGAGIGNTATAIGGNGAYGGGGGGGFIGGNGGNGLVIIEW